MSALLNGIVMVMVVCHIPKTVMNMFESYQVCTCNIYCNAIAKDGRLTGFPTSFRFVLLIAVDLKFRSVKSSQLELY